MKETKKPDTKGSTEESKIISSPVVYKNRIIKGEVQETGDYYIQRSIQDYFIKFCESKVSIDELEKYLTDQESMIKVVKAEVEFHNGEWDSCDEEAKVASRTGEYVVLLRLID